jgi:broad specificity phosphatase PhoE
MASNRELTATANELAKRLGVDVRTQGLSNRQLNELVEELEEKLQNSAEPEAEAEEARVEQPPFLEPAPEPAPVVETKPDPVAPTAPSAPRKVVVAHGVALTSARGILGPGTEVVPADFRGGQDTIDHLLSTGALVEV